MSLLVLLLLWLLLMMKVMYVNVSVALYYSEYEKTMQCLHLSFAHCRPGHLHLQLIAYRLGYLRTFMEQTCDQLDNEDDADQSEQEEEEEEEAAEDDDDGHSSPPLLQTTTTMADQTSDVTVNRPQMERQEIGGATMTRVISSDLVNITLRSALTTPIVVPSDFSKSRTVVEPPTSTSAPSASDLFSSSSMSRTPSSSATRSATLGATTSAHLRMTAEHLTNGVGAECGDALGCGGRELDVDRQQRTSLQRLSISSRSSQYSKTVTTTILAAIFPVVNSTLSRSFNGGPTLDPAATVAIQWPFPPSSSTGETTQTGALVTASSSIGGTKAVQCHPGVTCARTNSAGNRNRSHSLDYCLALSAILLLVCRVNICF